jgi:hypothetical protein
VRHREASNQSVRERPRSLRPGAERLAEPRTRPANPGPDQRTPDPTSELECWATEMPHTSPTDCAPRPRSLRSLGLRCSSLARWRRDGARRAHADRCDRLVYRLLWRTRNARESPGTIAGSTVGGPRSAAGWGGCGISYVKRSNPSPSALLRSNPLSGRSLESARRLGSRAPRPGEPRSRAPGRPVRLFTRTGRTGERWER